MLAWLFSKKKSDRARGGGADAKSPPSNMVGGTSSPRLKSEVGVTPALLDKFSSLVDEGSVYGATIKIARTSPIKYVAIGQAHLHLEMMEGDDIQVGEWVLFDGRQIRLWRNEIICSYDCMSVSMKVALGSAHVITSRRQEVTDIARGASETRIDSVMFVCAAGVELGFLAESITKNNELEVGYTEGDSSTLTLQLPRGEKTHFTIGSIEIEKGIASGDIEVNDEARLQAKMELFLKGFTPYIEAGQYSKGFDL